MVQDLWGRCGGVKGKWKAAERYALKHLPKEGFISVRLMDYQGFFPFDLRAEKNGGIHVFQVTTRTHEECRKARRVAKDLGLIFHIMFVKPDLSGHVLVQPSSNSYELSLGEVETLRSE